MMILATEIGDKTFFIAAVLSMKNDRIAVFLGAVAALVIMTILSTMMGFVLPSLIPRQYTTMFGGFLFLYFGMKLLYEGRGMKHGVSDELEEVEEELKIGRNKHHVGAAGGTKKKGEDTYENDDDEEDLKLESNMGGGGGPMMRSGGMKKKESGRDLMSADGGGGKKKIAVGANKNRPSWERIFMQSLSLTFLAEWGDRSQIATIALASHKDPYGVGFGGGLGHSLCTGVAVIGGRMLASRIDEKTVAIAGGFIFLVFGCHSVFFES